MYIMYFRYEAPSEARWKMYVCIGHVHCRYEARWEECWYEEQKEWAYVVYPRSLFNMKHRAQHAWMGGWGVISVDFLQLFIRVVCLVGACSGKGEAVNCQTWRFTSMRKKNTKNGILVGSITSESLGSRAGRRPARVHLPYGYVARGIWIGCIWLWVHLHRLHFARDHPALGASGWSASALSSSRQLARGHLAGLHLARVHLAVGQSSSAP